MSYDSAADADADRAHEQAQSIPDRTQQPTHRIDAQVIRYGNRGPVYRVMHAGQILLAQSRCPLFEACRALLARGITGRLELWRPGEATFDVACDVEIGARHTIAESETRSLQFGALVIMGCRLPCRGRALDGDGLFRRYLCAYPGANAKI